MCQGKLTQPTHHLPLRGCAHHRCGEGDGSCGHPVDPRRTTTAIVVLAVSIHRGPRWALRRLAAGRDRVGGEGDPHPLAVGDDLDVFVRLTVQDQAALPGALTQRGVRCLQHREGAGVPLRLLDDGGQDQVLDVLASALLGGLLRGVLSVLPAVLLAVGVVHGSSHMLGGADC